VIYFTNGVKMQNYLARNKIFAHPERLAEWITHGITKPITAEIDPSNRCNHYCPKCSGNRTDADAELSLDYMKKIIDETSPFLKGMVFTGGGEPLINKDTPEAIDYANRNGIEVGLITNGSLLDQFDTEQLLSNCIWIRVSVDGLNPEHYSIRSGTNEKEYHKVWDNVKLLTETKSKAGSKCVVGVAYLTENETPEQLFKFTVKGKEYGVDYVQFRPFHHSTTNLLEEITICKTLGSENFKVIAPEEKYRDEKFDYDRAFGDEFRFVISASGGMYPCCYTRGLDDFLLGNIILRGFENIWKSEERKEVSENKLRLKSCPPLCYKDPFNQLLWKIYKVKKDGKHLNFI
jgi:MoaA/NifB/PqqE/SkfB family radical SAM enzyme